MFGAPSHVCLATQLVRYPQFIPVNVMSIGSTTPITPPMQCLLALCSAGRIDPIPLAAALSADAWQAFWNLAKRHRVVPIVADSLQHYPAISVPTDIQAALQKAIRLNTLQALQRSAELVRFTRLFNEHAIPFVTFKGIALAQQMGLQAHQRHAGDIDLLLANPQDLWKADALVLAAGYQHYQVSPDAFNSMKRKRYYVRHVKDIMYIHPAKSIRLELHHRLFLNPKTCEFSSDQVYQRRSQCFIGKVSIPCMCQADHQLYLLLHGAMTYWFRLKWLCDLSAIKQPGNVYKQPGFWIQTESLGVQRMVTSGLYLANQLLGMPIAEHISIFHNTQPVVQKITQQARFSLLQIKPPNENLAGFSNNVTWYFNYIIQYHAMLRKNVSYKLQQLALYTVNTNDWQDFPLPDALFFLYYPLRPFIWLIRQFK